MERARVGVVGARGHVGRELIRLLRRHPRLEIAFVVSRSQPGQPVPDAEGLVFEDLGPSEVAARAPDAVVLALPNGHAAELVGVLDVARPETVIVDVSGDHRLDERWVYGLPELFRSRIAGARRVANPGCYATAAALALAPLAGLLDGPAHAFGVSGYSGAGTTPSPRNDVDALRDNVMPYALVGHAHEAEVSRHVAPVHLMPNVAPFFRGLTVTASMSLRAPITADDLAARYAEAYAGEPLVRLGEAIPLPRDLAGQPHAAIGGFAVAEGGRRAVVVAALDNLLKGAASQALQNLNLAFGLGETTGILPW